MSDPPSNSDLLPNAGLLRRLGAIVYDSLLVAALWMVVTALLLPFTHGEAITLQTAGPMEYLYRVVLLAVLIVFFGFFWTRKGQTPGMIAWRLKMVRDDGESLHWRHVIARLAGAFVSMAALALGYLWTLFGNHVAWHDGWSETRVVVLPKKR
jgi:uncharacterized RDD family membrane protein YckC